MASLQLKSPTLWVLFSLIFLPVIVCQTCPTECKCKHKRNSTYAICEVNSINNIDSINLQPEYVTVLHLRCKEGSSSPNSLKRGMFKRLFRLMSIIFYRCSFDYIDEEAFAGLNSFEDLLIFRSVNLTFPQNFFHHIRDLQDLVLAQSDWKTFSFDKLCILNNFRSLIVMKNPIRDIVENSTLCPGNNNSFDQLQKLTLSHNEIRILRTGFSKRFQSLYYLTVEANNIVEIQRGSLANLPQMEYLNIGRNSLQTLPDNFCAGCTELGHLIISSNPIAELPASFVKFQNLRRMEAENTSLSDISVFTKLSLMYLNVADSNITMIPYPFCGNSSILRYLLLARNEIKDIPGDTFKWCSQLLRLDLTGNTIKSLNESSFSGLETMEILSLSFNNISHIENSTFEALNKMNFLYLSFNFLTRLPALPYNLKGLKLTGNKLKTANFSESPILFRLYALYLDQNEIEIIKTANFYKFPNLLKLNLNKNKIRHFEYLAFSGLKRLTSLHIAHNNIENVNSSLRILTNLRHLYAEHNRVSTLNKNMFPPLLHKINLSNNKIKTIEEGTFENLQYLKNVDLRWNELIRLDSSSMRLHPNIMTVTTFSVFGNPLKCDCHLASLKNNSINKYPIFLDLAPSECLQDDIHHLESSSVNPNQQQQQFVCSYKSNSLFTLPFSCYLNCQCCLTENCLCQNKCAASCICTFRYDLTEFRVDCQNRNLTDGTDIPHHAMLVDLSANELGYLTNKSFSKTTMAEILYLNHSKITGINAGTFVSFDRLKVLHLEYNEIRILDVRDLLGLRNLTNLILNHNKIERILPGTFNVTPSLELLDLSHNSLKKIDSQTFNIDNLKSILLFDNPWSCDCEDVNSLSDILINRFSQIDSQNILCDQTNIPMIEYKKRKCHRSDILNNVHVYVLSICLPILVVLLGIMALVYVCHMEIQLFFFIRFGWRILSKKHQLDEMEHEYDAFVSYHNSQNAFVTNELLPRLEENTSPAYKLCIHFRDFPVGTSIVDNIIESIENSKRTILLLTNEFLTSEWCRYEFQAAHLESLSNKMNSLIVVLLEDVDPHLIDGELKLIMKTETYLRYNDPRFWEKLLFVLPDKKEN